MTIGSTIDLGDGFLYLKTSGTGVDSFVRSPASTDCLYVLKMSRVLTLFKGSASEFFEPLVLALRRLGPLVSCVAGRPSAFGERRPAIGW